MIFGMDITWKIRIFGSDRCFGTPVSATTLLLHGQARPA